MENQSLGERVLRAYGVGLLTMAALLLVATAIGSQVADNPEYEGFEGLGVWLMWVFGALALGVLLQIPLGRLVGLGWGYGFVLVALVAVVVAVSAATGVWGLFLLSFAVAPYAAAALTRRR